MEITGQIITRDFGNVSDLVKSKHLPVNPNSKLIGLVGLIQAPADLFKSEHQYTLFGKSSDMINNLSILRDGSINLTKELYGSSLGQALLMPIWRI